LKTPLTCKTNSNFISSKFLVTLFIDIGDDSTTFRNYSGKTIKNSVTFSIIQWNQNSFNNNRDNSAKIMFGF